MMTAAKTREREKAPTNHSLDGRKGTKANLDSVRRTHARGFAPAPVRSLVSLLRSCCWLLLVRREVGGRPTPTKKERH